jgi:hypothetical protein
MTMVLYFPLVESFAAPPEHSSFSGFQFQNPGTLCRFVKQNGIGHIATLVNLRDFPRVSIAVGTDTKYVFASRIGIFRQFLHAWCQCN